MKRHLFLLSIMAIVGSCQFVRAGSIVRFKTDAGVMLVELFDDVKPITVNNFIRLIQNGAYDDSFIHRADPGFVIQGGGYRRVGDNYYYVPNFGPVVNEYQAGQVISNTYGTIAMAKASDPDSATSQWFFNLGNNVASLNNTNNSGGFTVFGRVFHGLDILAYFNNTNNYHILTNALFFARELPSHSTNIPPASGDLFFSEICLVTITNIAFQSNNTTIRWPNAIGVTNYIQATSDLNGQSWSTIGALYSPDDSCVFADTNAATGIRFYRIAIETNGL